MHFKSMISIFISILVAALLAACGSSSSGGVVGTGADTFTLNTVLYTEVANAVAPGGYDPLMVGVYNTTPSLGTSVDLFRGNIDNAGSWDEALNLFFPGQTIGLYTNSTALYNGEYLPTISSATHAYIDVTQYDAVGGRIQGTFDLALCHISEVLKPVCFPILLTGSFDVTREADQ